MTPRFHQLAALGGLLAATLAPAWGDGEAPGCAQPALGPHHVVCTPKGVDGDTVEISLPIRIPAGGGVLPEDVAVNMTLYGLTDDLDIIPAPDSPTLTWPAGQKPWKEGEVRLRVSYSTPPTGDAVRYRYYGFVATLCYQRKVLECVGSSVELMPGQPAVGEEAVGEPAPAPAPTEEAVPYSEYLETNPGADDALAKPPAGKPAKKP